MSEKQDGEAFDFFLVLWNIQQGQTTPMLHIRMARWLERMWQDGHRRLLLMAFRSSGKSTLVGLFAAWLLSRDPNLRLLVVAADMALARTMVRNVKRIIERHPLTGGLRPDLPDQWAADRFTINRPLELRDPSMLARGIGANVTGSRADIVICDDVEVPNTCDTALKRAELRQRLGELDYVLVPGGTELFVGTPHTAESIYKEAGEGAAAFLDDFDRLEIPILDAAGHSAWPERFTDAALARLREATGPNKFASQMMLRPVAISEGRLDPACLVRYAAELDYREAQGRTTLALCGRRLRSASCWWDPAFGLSRRGSAAGDNSVLALVFSDEAGGYWLHAVAYLSAEADAAVDEATQQCRAVAAFAERFFVPAVTVEINGLGRFLPGLLRRELAAAGVPCAVVEAASSRPKDIRIVEAFDAVLAAGALHAHESIWETPLIAEMREWRPGARGYDDGLDAVAGALSAEPVRIGSRSAGLAANRSMPRGDWRHGGRPLKADSDFKV